jgi:hypothetical protein
MAALQCFGFIFFRMTTLTWTGELLSCTMKNREKDFVENFAIHTIFTPLCSFLMIPIICLVPFAFFTAVHMLEKGEIQPSRHLFCNSSPNSSSFFLFFMYGIPAYVEILDSTHIRGKIYSALTAE